MLLPILILQAKKFLKCDWLRPVVFEQNLKYLHVKNYSFHGDLNDRNNMAEIFPKCDGKTTRTKGNNKKCEQQRTYKYLGHCLVDLKGKTKDTDLTF